MSIAIRREGIGLRSGHLETLKWIALVAMVVDHTNTVLFSRELGTWAEAIGRLAFPLFATVFGLNLSRPGVDFYRVARRLLVVALISTPVYIAVFQVWPLNVLFTLLAGVLFLALCKDRRSLLAALLFLVAGLFVDYLWPGIAVVLAAWMYAKRPSFPVGMLYLAALGCVCLCMGNWWAMLAVPVLYLVNESSFEVPRLRWIFLAFYPVHLVVLWALRVVA